MIKMAIRNLFYNKKRTLMIILSICLSSTLLLIISLLFSSVHDFMIKEIIKDKPYHVLIKTEEFKQTDYIKSISYKNDEALIQYNEIKDTYSNTDLLCQKIKCDEIKYNDALLSLYGLSKKENVLSSFKSLLVTVFLILGFGVFILITNAFTISLSERKKQIGVLRSMGMTKWQFMKMNLKEVLIVLIIGLVISLIFSFWLMQLLLVIINYLLKDIFTSKFVLTIYIPFLLMALVFIVFLVIGSSIWPMIRSSRVSVMKAICGNDDFKNKKLPNWTKKFAITRRLAFYNYYRCKRKYLVVTFCIFISVLLYTSFSLYLRYGINTINSYSETLDYDFEVIGNGNEEAVLALDDLGKKFEKHKLVKSCLLKGKIAIDSYLDKNDYTDSKQILIVQNNKERVINRLVEINEKDGRLVKDNRKYLKKEVLVDGLENGKIKTTDEIPWGLKGLLNKDNVILLTDKFEHYCPEFGVNLFIKGDSAKALAELKKTKNIDVSYVDVKKALRLRDNLLLVIKLCLYGVVGLVILVGFSSIINIMHASLNLRTKEFGLLFSMGLTKKQLNKMLLFESLLMLIKAFVLAFPFTLIVNYILYYSVNMVFEVSIIWPLKELLLSFVVSLFLIYLTLKSIYKSFYHREITSMISSDNV